MEINKWKVCKLEVEEKWVVSGCQQQIRLLPLPKAFLAVKGPLQRKRKVERALNQMKTQKRANRNLNLVVVNNIWRIFKSFASVISFTELQNVKSFTRSKSSRPNFNPRKAGKLQQIFGTQKKYKINTKGYFWEAKAEHSIIQSWIDDRIS